MKGLHLLDAPAEAFPLLLDERDRLYLARYYGYEARLATALGRRVELNVVVDPTVVGGLRVQSGPDVIDATVLARLADARRRLAS